MGGGEAYQDERRQRRWPRRAVHGEGWRCSSEKARSGRYADASDVMRDALRALEQREDLASPALEAALLEGVRSPHRPYGKVTLERIRKAAQRSK